MSARRGSRRSGSGPSVAAMGVSQVDSWLLPAGSVGASYSRANRTVNVGILTTQILYLAAGFIPAGKTVANLSFKSAGTPASVPTNWWYVLLDQNLAILGITADQLTTAWAAQTTKTLALVTPAVTTYTGRYYAGIMMKATTPVTLHGVDPAATSPTDETPKLYGASNTGLTTPASLGAGPATAITTGLAWPFWWAT